MRSGHPTFRYLRSEDDRERITKIFRKYGNDEFTMSDLKEDILPDTCSGEICRWSWTKVIEKVGKTSEKSPTNVWRLSDSVIEVISREFKNGR
jgi:hypothetical protein